MSNYPEVVTKIADDYLQRLRLQLRLLPAREQNEFVMEIQSHVYEAYQQSAGTETAATDDVARILAVLRKLGEPAEVVADRLPDAMVRTGKKRNLPLYIVGGIVIALFGIPLGFSGVATLLGLVTALAGILLAYYAATGIVLLTGAFFTVLGIVRMGQPVLWDRLLALGYIQINGQVGEFFNALSPEGQGFILFVFAGAFLACGVGLLWMGRYLVRGLRMFFSLTFDWARRLAQSIRRKLRKNDRGELEALLA